MAFWYKKRILAVLLLSSEITSFVLDRIGGSNRLFLVASFLLSAIGFVTTIYTCFFSSTVPAVTRSESGRQLIAVDIVFSFIQLVLTYIQLIRVFLGAKSNNNNESLLPLAFAVISVVFSFRNNEKAQVVSDSESVNQIIFRNDEEAQVVSDSASVSQIFLLETPAVDDESAINRKSSTLRRRTTSKEAPKMRLVRCPKCGNVLPEPQNCSVYLCGGCDTLLIAKKIPSASDDVLEKSNEEDNVDGYKKLETLSEKLSSRLDSLSEVERERDRVELSRRKDRVPVDENVNLVGVSSTRTKNEEILIDHEDVNARVNSKGLRFDQGIVDREVKFGDKRRQSSKQPIDEWVGGDDHDLNLNRSKSVSSSVVKGIGGISISSQFKNSSEVKGSRVVLDRWGVEREGHWGFDEDPRTVPEHRRFSPSAYHDEGPSNLRPNSFYGYGEPMENLGYPHREPFRVENLEQDRAEILRKLNDLKEQISRLDEKPRGTTRPESSRGDVPLQPFEVNHTSRPPNLIYSGGPASLKNDRNLDMHRFYPPPRLYKEQFRSQQLRRPPTRYTQQPHRDYFLGRSADFDQDLLASRSQETFLHQPACSCLHCYNKN